MPSQSSYNLYARFIFKAQPGLSQMQQFHTKLQAVGATATRAAGQMRLLGGAMAASMAPVAGKAFGMMKKGANQMAVGFQKVGRQVGMFGAVTGLVLGGIVKEGAGFERQMSIVRSIVSGITQNEFADMEKKAMDLGRTTSFTAVQAGQGMELLSRAGFKAKETIDAIRPTLKLAEADSIDLASSADIVASAIRTFGLEAKDATRVTDVLAWTSSNSNTNVLSLGESLKFAGSIARINKVSFEETVSVLGMLGDIGLKGTLAGTAVKNALLKMAKPSKKVLDAFGGIREFQDKILTDNGKMRKFNEIMGLIMQKLGGMDHDAKRAALAIEIFGLRGITTLGAFNAKNLNGANRFLKDMRENADGTAERMAKIRLENLAGQWVLFKSALSGVAIQIFKTFGPMLTDYLKDATHWMAQFGFALREVGDGADEADIANKFGKPIADIIFGIKEGASEAWGIISGMAGAVGKFFGFFAKDGESSTKNLTRMVVKFGLLAAAITPVVMAMTALGLAASGAFGMVAGAVRLIGGGLTLALGGARKLMGGNGGGLGGRVLGKVTGGLAGGGTPVFVTNWPIMSGGLPGAASKAGGGALDVARRGIPWAGAPLLKTLFGGIGAPGTMTASQGVASALGTVASTATMFAAALLPAWAGMTEIGKAYDPEFLENYRKKILSSYKEDQRGKNWLEEIKKFAPGYIKELSTKEEAALPESERTRRRQMRLKTRLGTRLGTGYTGGEDFLNFTNYLLKTIGGGTGEEVAGAKTVLERKTKVALGGKMSQEEYIKTIARMSVEDWASTGKSEEERSALLNLAKVNWDAISKAKPQEIVIKIDGKAIATAVINKKIETNERSGGKSEPGKKRQALQGKG